MHIRFFAALGSAACLLLPLPVHADDSPTSVRRTLQFVYNYQDNALAHKDGEGTLYCIAPDYVGTDLKGVRVTLANRREDMPVFLLTLKSGRATTQIRKLYLHGNQAVAIVLYRSSVTVRVPTKHKEATGTYEFLIRDTWIKQFNTTGENAWLQETRQVLSDRRVR